MIRIRVWVTVCGVVIISGTSMTYAACDCTQIEVTGVSQTECEALIALYVSTNGPEWAINANWDTVTVIGSWFGVTVEEGHVTALSLFANQLTGSIPAALGNLSYLERLILSRNQLTGGIPAELGGLGRLLSLELNSNQLTGVIPAELGSLSRLQDLMLGSNQLTGGIPADLGKLSDLQTLYLYSNQLTGDIPVELGNLSHLRYLYLYSNRLTGGIPAAFGNLRDLTGLRLYANQLIGEIPAAITNMSALEPEPTGIGYNMLTATDSAVIAFLDARDPDWAKTQTVPPSDVSTHVITENTVQVTWTPIAYKGDGGYYRAKYATASGGPYTDAGTTMDKFASGFTVTGLSPNTAYYFVVETFTPAHGTPEEWIYQQNDLTSHLSLEVSTVILPGDVNGDGDVNLFDAILVLKMLSGVGAGADPIHVEADVNGDDRLGVEEVLYIFRRIADGD